MKWTEMKAKGEGRGKERGAAWRNDKALYNHTKRTTNNEQLYYIYYIQNILIHNTIIHFKYLD
jgi:hypothetical protein